MIDSLTGASRLYGPAFLCVWLSPRIYTSLGVAAGRGLLRFIICLRMRAFGGGEGKGEEGGGHAHTGHPHVFLLRIGGG